MSWPGRAHPRTGITGGSWHDISVQTLRPPAAVEHENLRSALAWFAGGGADPGRQLRLAVALAQYCQLRGRYTEGRGWLTAALTVAGAPSAAPVELFGGALWATAAFALLMCDYEDAQRLAERALAAQRQCGDGPGVARTLRLLAAVARERGEYQRSLAALDQAAVACTGGQAAAGVLQHTGFTRWVAGDLDGAERALADAVRGYERLEDPEGVASTRIHLAAVALHRGQLALAERLAAEQLARFTELDVKEGIAWAQNIVGLAALGRGRHAEAVAALRASLELHCTVGDRWRQASVLEALAATLLTAGEPVRAAELSGLAAAIRGALGVPVPAQERPAWEHTQAALRWRLPDGEHRAATTRGAALRAADVVTSLENRLPSAPAVGTVARWPPAPR